MPPVVTTPLDAILNSVPGSANLPLTERTASALNFWLLWFWNIDLISLKPWATTELIVKLLTTPLTLIGSSTKNLPLTLFIVTEFPFAAAVKNPLAPLLWPSIKDPSAAVRLEFNPIVVNISKSHKDNSYSLVIPS